MFFKKAQKKSKKTQTKTQRFTLSRQQSVLLGGFLTLFGIALIISFGPVSLVKPLNTPRELESQYGAPKPVKAGTR